MVQIDKKGLNKNIQDRVLRLFDSHQKLSNRQINEMIAVERKSLYKLLKRLVNPQKGNPILVISTPVIDHVSGRAVHSYRKIN